MARLWDLRTLIRSAFSPKLNSLAMMTGNLLSSSKNAYSRWGGKSLSSTSSGSSIEDLTVLASQSLIFLGFWGYNLLDLGIGVGGSLFKNASRMRMFRRDLISRIQLPGEVVIINLRAMKRFASSNSKKITFSKWSYRSEMELATMDQSSEKDFRMLRIEN
ncbi:hypothetical protein Tco_1153625 [Tanacetum coccineum]